MFSLNWSCLRAITASFLFEKLSNEIGIRPFSFNGSLVGLYPLAWSFLNKLSAFDLTPKAPAIMWNLFDLVATSKGENRVSEKEGYAYFDLDITNNNDALALTGKSQKELLRRLHVIDNEKVVGGAKAFLIIWDKIPKYKILSKIFSFKPLFLIFHYFYEIVAYFLFIKNKNQLKWKNKIYQPKYVLFAKDLLPGEKNGN